MSKIPELAASLAAPAVEAQGCTLWDVEYVKEAGTRYLRIYIDKEDGVNIDDCVAISHAVDALLDEADLASGGTLFPEPYTFEVSSAGADRLLKRPAHFEAFTGAAVDVGFYRAINGAKFVTGILTGYQDGDVTVQIGEETVTFPKADVASVRAHIDFD